ncbi:MAG: hypothetical protein ACOCXJ_00480 [Planctomycetota bacterium]
MSRAYRHRSTPAALGRGLLRMLLLGLLVCTMQAGEYAVLILQTQPHPDEASRMDMRELCTELNRRCADGDPLPAYFGLVRTTDGQDLLLYGWRPPVRGLLPADFPRTRDGLRRMHAFDAATWKPVSWLRRRLDDHAPP